MAHNFFDVKVIVPAIVGRTRFLEWVSPSVVDCQPILGADDPVLKLNVLYKWFCYDENRKGIRESLSTGPLSKRCAKLCLSNRVSNWEKGGIRSSASPCGRVRVRRIALKN